MSAVDVWVAVAFDDDGHCGVGTVLQAQKTETRISRRLRVKQENENIAVYKAIEAAVVSGGYMAAAQVTIHLDVPTVITAMRDGIPPHGCARYANRIHQQAQHYGITVIMQYAWGPEMALAHALANLALLKHSAEAKEWAKAQNITLIL